MPMALYALDVVYFRRGAAAHWFSKVTGTLKNGRRAGSWVRVTRLLPVVGGQVADHARARLDGGWVIVMDEAVDEELVAPSDDPLQRFFANASPLWCLPQGRPAPDAASVGTVMRPAALRALVAEAGFTQVDVLPIEHPFWRFYRLA